MPTTVQMISRTVYDKDNSISHAEIEGQWGLACFEKNNPTRLTEHRKGSIEQTFSSTFKYRSAPGIPPPENGVFM